MSIIINVRTKLQQVELGFESTSLRNVNRSFNHYTGQVLMSCYNYYYTYEYDYQY